MRKVTTTHPRHADLAPYARRPDAGSTGKVKAHGAILSVQAVFALWYIVGHIVLSDNDPLTFALVRECVASIALLGLARSVEGQVGVKSRDDLVDVVILVRGRPAPEWRAARLRGALFGGAAKPTGSSTLRPRPRSYVHTI